MASSRRMNQTEDSEPKFALRANCASTSDACGCYAARFARTRFLCASCPCQKIRQVSTCRIFYSSRRLGMESRVSVYGIAVGAWNHRRCIFCGLIPYRITTDSIQCFALIPYTPHGVICGAYILSFQSPKMQESTTPHQGVVPFYR